MIYANFLHSHDEELLETPLLKTVRDSIILNDDEEDDDLSMFDEDAQDESEKPPVVLTDEQKAMISKLERKRFIDLSVTVEDQETGEEFELPPVRLILEKTRQKEVSDGIAQ